jgi:serine/threonine protein phosphatase PrpC
MRSLITCVTDTIKSTTNQDAYDIVVNECIRGVIVADGIGSHYKSEIAAQSCVETIKKGLSKVRSAKNIDFKLLFQQAKEQLITYADQNKDLKEVDRNRALGTTLICALELEKEIKVAYVGNGCIWHIQGNFNSFGPHRYLPWNSINLLNPHSVDEGGKAALYKYLSPNEVNCEPTQITITKNNPFGDIILIATDGIYSYDQVLVGKDDEGSIWVSGEETMALFYQALSKVLTDNGGTMDEKKLESAMGSYLRLLKEKQLMNDDTTLGLIISSQALKYAQRASSKEAYPSEPHEADNNT